MIFKSLQETAPIFYRICSIYNILDDSPNEWFSSHKKDGNQPVAA